MSARVLRALLLVWLVAVPALAEGGEHGGDEEGLLFPLLNFGLLVGVLVFLTRKRILAYFAERRSTIQDDLDRSAELQRQAEERHAKLQRRLVELERELDEIRRLGHERAESERDQILADARDSAARIERTARSAIDQELRRAREKLREEASELAVDLAAGLLGERVTEADRDRLLDEFIARVEQAPAPSARREN